MINLAGLVYRIGGVRPDISPTLHLNALQVAARRLCADTLRLLARVSIPVTSASFSAGWHGESLLTPDLSTHAPTLDDGTTGDTTTYFPLRVLGARLRNSTDQSTLDLDEQDLPGLRKYMDRAGDTDLNKPVSRFWADASGAVMLYPGYQQDLGFDRLDLQLAVTPTDNEFTKILLPANYEFALLENALSVAYEMGGKGQSLNASKDHQYRYLNLVAGLVGQNLIGTSGAPGRRLTPFDVQIRTR